MKKCTVMPVLRQVQDKLLCGQAGIQQLNQPAQRTQSRGSLATLDIFNQLDSSLRRNDGVL